MVSWNYFGSIWLVARSTLITYLVVGLNITGLFFIASASVVGAARDFGDKWYYLKLQSLWTALGLGLFFIASKFPYQKLEKTAVLLLGFSLLSLVLVLIPGIGTKVLGARRWISVGWLGFQPGEFTKFSLCIYLASFLKQKTSAFLPFVSILGLSCGLIMLQPDLGTTIVISVLSLLIYFGSPNSLKQFLYALPIGIGLVLLLVFSSPYRRDRINTFFHPEKDLQGTSYHIHQVLLSLGSGGFWGVGLGQSRQKYDFLPEATTDSIFAVIAEELGFVGASVLIITYLLLIATGLAVVKSTTHPFGYLLSLGITAWIGIQTTINLAAMVAIFPLTGIPLPYISYGGTSLVLMLFASGILVNIAAHHDI